MKDLMRLTYQDIPDLRSGTMVGLLASDVWAEEGEYVRFFIRFRSLSPAVGLKKRSQWRVALTI
jgi:hypothetical protein